MNGNLFLFFQRTLAIFFLAAGLYALPYQAQAQSYSRAEIKAVQQNLSEYGAGKADGKFGRNTAKAIRQYQADWDIPVTGKISDELIQRLERTHPETKPRWQKIKYKNNCKIWNEGPQAFATVVWSGSCSNGKANGKGQLAWQYIAQQTQKQSSFKGEFRNGKKHGQGVYTWANGNRYEGEYRDGKWHGQGVYTWANGDRYEGEYRNDKKHGQGVYTQANGNRYEGEFRNGKWHGQGVTTWVNGDRYEGEYRDDKRTGQGVYTWGEGSQWAGDRYEGELRDGKQHGQGVKTWASGDRYEGEFRDDKPHGWGEKYNASSGKTYSGIWRRGCLSAGGYNHTIGTTDKACGF